MAFAQRVYSGAGVEVGGWVHVEGDAPDTKGMIEMGDIHILAFVLLLVILSDDVLIGAILLLAILMLILSYLLLRSIKKKAMPPVRTNQYRGRQEQEKAQKKVYEQVTQGPVSSTGSRQKLIIPDSEGQMQKDLSSVIHSTSHYRCSRCGEEVFLGDRFCMACGNLIAPLWDTPAQQDAAVIQSPAPDQRPPLRTGDNIEEDIASWRTQMQPIKEQQEEETLHGNLSHSALADERVRQKGLLVLRVRDRNLREYTLREGETSIGRSSSNDIVLGKDRLTSRHHALVRYENGQYCLVDNLSANGTVLNGESIPHSIPRPLHEGDVIRIGIWEFHFHMVTAAEVKNAVMPASLPDTPTPVVDLASIGEEHIDTSVNHAFSIAAPSTPPVPAVRATQDSRPGPLLKQISFTAFHPRDIEVNSWNTLLVYAHRDEVIEAVFKDADFFRLEIEDTPRHFSRPKRNPLLQGNKLTVVPECKGVVFNPRRYTFTWMEDWHRAMFRFSVKKEALEAGTKARINVFVGPLLIATLDMEMLFPAHILPGQASGAQISTRPYQRIFAAYSQLDMPIVEAYQYACEALGYNSFIVEQEKLFAGGTFSISLRAAIANADIFQLFWSKHAAASPAVEQEWKYALQMRKGKGFIRPVYWDVPLAPLPNELAGATASYIPSYTFASPSSHPSSSATSSS